MLVLIVFLLIPATFAQQNCLGCVNSGNLWCVDTSSCNSTFTSCTTLISLPFNCPTSPKFEYDDHFVRTQQMTLMSAIHGETVQLCFDNQIPTMKHYQTRTVNCSTQYSDVTCAGYTAYDVTQKVVTISFRGAHGADQIMELNQGMEQYGLQSYPNMQGKIFKVIYDKFMILWNGGLGQDLRQLKYKYPDFELWVNGHSLGALFSWTAATYIQSIGLYKPADMKVIVMGAGRLGDYDFAEWFTNTFEYSFHVVHRRDAATRSPLVDPHTNTTLLFHPRTEVWYNNYMNEGDEFVVCPEADGNYCSETVTTDLSSDDHLYYFNLHLPNWGRAGCTTNTTIFHQD